MRTKNSIRNIVVALCSNIIVIVLNFLTQKYLIQRLGIEYSGLNSVLSNVISMLSITELGIGTAIIYHLYKPIALDDIPLIKSLMSLYKKAYRVIAGIILILGIASLPLIHLFIDSSNIKESIYIIYILFVLDSSISYLASYKRSLVYANQKNRYIDLIHIGYTIGMNVSQILILFFTNNFILYLSIKVVFRIIENIAISIVATKLYPYLNDKNISKLDNDIKNDIIKKVKAQVMHSVGGYIVLGTDNIIISYFFGLAIAGIYGNYIMIINAVGVLLSQVFTALTASIGNLLVENDKDKNYIVFKRIFFINFIIYSLAAIVMYFAINDLILIWLKNVDYLFSNSIVLCLCINFYMQGMRRTMQAFASGAGICYENRFVPIVEAIINIIASIILLSLFGVIGVVLGTIISTFVLHFYSFPKYIYKPLFNRKGYRYCLEFLYYTFLSVIGFVLLYFFNSFSISNLYLQLLLHLCTGLILLIFYVIIFIKNNEFKFYVELFNSKWRR